jgi:hypothetical protein
VQAKRVTFPVDRLSSDLPHWVDIKRFLPGAPLSDYVLNSLRMCMFGRLDCSSVAQPWTREQGVILLRRDQLANLQFL